MSGCARFELHGVYVEAQQEVSEYEDKYHTCLEHYLELFHLCQGKFMEDIRGPINHTKLLRESGFKFTK
jgi:hypothetical protein